MRTIDSFNMNSVIITSPSFDSKVNIGGISVLTKLTTDYNKAINYKHFVIGRKDGDKTSLIWLINQLVLPLKFTKFLLKNNKARICHINMPQDNKGIIRDSILVLLSKSFNRTVVVHLHGGEYNMRTIRNILIRNIFKQILIISDTVICLGNDEKLSLLNKYGVNENKVQVLENAVEIKTNNLIKGYSGVIKIIFIGRIDKNKGFDEIIQTLKIINREINLRFILCGSGPYERFVLEELTDILGDKFEFHGVVSRSLKDKLFSESHIFILPSYFEGLPNALLEAMSFGLVPICTAVGSIPNVIKNELNGYLIPLRNSSLLSDKILYLEKNRSMLEKMGMSAYKTMFDKYSIKVYVSRLNRIYDCI